MRAQRTRRPPARLNQDDFGSELQLQQAMRKSLLETTRVVSEVPEAPVFRPTAAEFENPLAYIASIQGQAAQFGIAKIIPPAGWANPDLELNIGSRFITKSQSVHTLQEGQPFKEGPRFNQAEYHSYADNFAAAFMKTHPQLQAARRTMSADDYTRLLEQTYWDIVERSSNDEVIVNYANDIDTEKVGSAFGKWAGRWDMTKLSSEPQSALSDLGYSVEGLTHPWLYFGALFATFCWHTEDHFLCSMNYMHTGASKTWYGVPGSGVRKFEEIMQNIFPERFSEDRDILHHLVTVAPPSLLTSRGLKVVHTVQSAGEYVVTFSKAYHCGFSHGWNCSEAVNFATLDWLPAGLDAVRRYAQGPGKRPAVFSHDKLVWELSSDALEAHRVQNGGVEQLPPPQPGFAASAAYGNQRLASTPASSVEYHSATANGTLPGHISQETLQQLPRSVERHTVSFTVRQLKQLVKALAPIVSSEAQAYKELKFEGAHQEMMLLPCSTPGCVEADMRSCSECGALPYFSYVYCSCSPGKARCLPHAHIGCTCEWARKRLALRFTEATLTRRLNHLEKLIMQDTAVQAMLPKRWAGSCKAPVTAAAAAATEHHTRPSVQGSADDVAAASSRSQLQDARQGKRIPPSIKRGGSAAKQARLFQWAKQARRDVSRSANDDSSSSSSSSSSSESSIAGSNSSSDSDTDAKPDAADGPPPSKLAPMSATASTTTSGSKRASATAVLSRLWSGADKRAKMRADAHARDGATVDQLPRQRLHPMPPTLVQSKPLAKAEVHVTPETHVKQEADVKLEAKPQTLPVLPSSPQNLTISRQLQRGISITPHAIPQTGNSLPHIKQNSCDILRPGSISEGRQSSAARSAVKMGNETAASSSPAAAEQRFRAAVQSPCLPEASRKGVVPIPLTMPSSLKAGKPVAAPCVRFEPLPMSRAEKLRRGLLSSS